MGFSGGYLKTKRYMTISGSQLQRMINTKNNVLILDVRDIDDFNGGHIPNAINMPLNELSSRIQNLNPYRKSNIVVYCASGMRSTKAADILSKHGFRQVYNLRGGISAYKGNLMYY